MAAFLFHARREEAAGKEPLLSLGLFRNRVSNLGLVTQNVQTALLVGSTFVIAVFLETFRHDSAIKTGVIFTASTAGILVSSLSARRLARRFSQRNLIVSGFITAIAGIAVMLGLVQSSFPGFPGLLVFGRGVGLMLPPSVNIVQSAFPESRQGEISGLSRAVSNLGSAIGTAVAGTILVADLAHGDRNYGLALVALVVFAAGGLIAALSLRRNPQLSGHP